MNWFNPYAIAAVFLPCALGLGLLYMTNTGAVDYLFVAICFVSLALLIVVLNRVASEKRDEEITYGDERERRIKPDAVESDLSNP